MYRTYHSLGLIKCIHVNFPPPPSTVITNQIINKFTWVNPVRYRRADTGVGDDADGLKGHDPVQCPR